MMANQAHVTLLTQGVTVWNAWQEQHPDILTDPGRADLKGIDLSAKPTSALPT